MDSLRALTANIVMIEYTMIYTGTCSWTEKTLIQSGEFYPKEARTAEARLKYYAEHFSTVEVDSSYYAIPDKSITALWSDWTPKNFVFHIKAYGALTGHGIKPKTLPIEIATLFPKKDREKKYVYIKEADLLKIIAEKFWDSLRPLVKENKLGILVFQFPPWFQYRIANLDYILQCKELMKGLPIAVEFRHGSWLTHERAGSIFSFLRKHRISYIGADEPQYGSLATIPFIPEVTSDVAYFRFHGRNKENWLRREIETSFRYDYLYSDDELKEFIEQILDLGRNAKKAYAMFNNCHGASAVRNARRLKELIVQEKADD